MLVFISSFISTINPKNRKKQKPKKSDIKKNGFLITSDIRMDFNAELEVIKCKNRLFMYPKKLNFCVLNKTNVKYICFNKFY